MVIAEVLRQKGTTVHKVRDFDGVTEAVHVLTEARIGAVVVVNAKGELSGMFSERDIVRALHLDGPIAVNHKVASYMTPRVTTCAPSDRVDHVLKVMSVSRIRHVPVVSEGRLLGLVSIGDLVKVRLAEKEQEANVLLDITRSRI